MTAEISPAYALSQLTPDWIASLSAAELAVLPYMYDLWLRPEQHLPTHAFRTCGLGAGRGWGKGATICPEINRRVEAGEARHVLLMAPTEDRVVDVQMNPLIEYAPPWFKPEIINGDLVWPNGVRALAFTPTGASPRGENADLSWCTELVDWDPNTQVEAFKTLATATRIGRAQVLWDSTSKGRNDLLNYLYENNERDPEQHPILLGTMFDNTILSLPYLRSEYNSYSGVRRAEEIFGKRFKESAGALWKQKWIDRTRVEVAPAFEWEHVGVDPAQSTNPGSDLTGIIRGGRGFDKHAYLTKDLSGKLRPEEWGDIVVSQFPRGRGRVTIERNHIGDNASYVLRSRASNMTPPLQVVTIGKDEAWPPLDPRIIHVREVTSRDSKTTRAEGPALEHEQGRVHHVGEFAELEKEQTTYVVGTTRSPNRYDAAAFCLTELRELSLETKPDAGADMRAAAQAQTQLMGAIVRRGGRLGL